MCKIVFVLALFVLIPVFYAAETTSAQVNVPSNPLRLEIREGKISADFKDIPVSTVLEEIRRQSGIHYRAPAELAGFSVSVTLEDLPLDQGLALILAPFNYIITQEGTTPHHRVVQLLGLKENNQRIPTSSPPAGTAEAPRSNNPPQAPEPPTSAELAGATTPSGKPELPPFTPMASPQGPGHNETPSQPLPASTPVSNTTGPVAPATGQYRELPPFAPVTNQTGPVPTK